MEGISELLKKFSVEDIEKMKFLMSFVTEMKTREVITLQMFADEYAKFIKQNRSAAYYTSVNNSFKHLINFFGPQKIILSIGFKETEEFISDLQQKVTKGYRVYVRTLKAAFNKAVEWNYIKENHFLKVKLPKKQKINPAFINSEQLSTIYNQVENDTIRDIVITGFYTGMRLDEIINLKWKNVNLEARIITVGDEEYITKGRNQRFIPISDEALASLLSRRKRMKAIPIGDSFVFSKSNGTKFSGDHISRSFKIACQVAGIDKAIHFHSLRHSFASNLVQQGVSLYKVKELLGHSAITTTEIYSHLNIESLRDAIKIFDCPQPDLPPRIEGERQQTSTFTKSTGLRLITTSK